MNTKAKKVCCYCGKDMGEIEMGFECPTTTTSHGICLKCLRVEELRAVYHKLLSNDKYWDCVDNRARRICAKIATIILPADRKWENK